MNTSIVLGILLIVCGVLLFAAAEIILVIKIKKFNSEWTKGADDGEVS